MKFVGSRAHWWTRAREGERVVFNRGKAAGALDGAYGAAKTEAVAVCGRIHMLSTKCGEASVCIGRVCVWGFNYIGQCARCVRAVLFGELSDAAGSGVASVGSQLSVL